MNDDKIIIDLGNWTTPTSWDDVTLEQFQKMEENSDITDMIAVLTNHTKDEVMQLPSDVMEMLLNTMDFLTTPMPQTPPTNKIEIDGQTYQINIMEKLKTGEYVAFDSIVKSDPKNYAAILGVLCRKEGEIYDSKFEAEIFEQREKMFLKAPITKIMPTVAFFLNLWVTLKTPTQLSLEVEELINHTQANIQSLRKSGDLSALSTASLMRKLKKLRKLIKNI